MHCYGGELSISAFGCNRSEQVLLCSVNTVPFALELSVDHLVQCHSSNSMQTSPSYANLEIYFRDAISPAASIQ
jgi:hypothetical protein